MVTMSSMSVGAIADAPACYGALAVQKGTPSVGGKDTMSSDGSKAEFPMSHGETSTSPFMSPNRWPIGRDLAAGQGNSGQPWRPSTVWT